MYGIEVILLTNNVIYPFQNLNLPFTELNKLFATHLISEHGLGFLINIYEKSSSNLNNKLLKQIIFDTGGSNNTFIHNLDVFNFPLYDLDTIVLSHWHYDHFGSLYKVLERVNKKVKLITHQDALFERIFKRAKGLNNDDIVGKSKEELVPLFSDSRIILQEPINMEKIKAYNCSLSFNKELSEIFISDGIRILASGEIPRKNRVEDFKSFFSLQDNVAKLDKIQDDKCLFLEFDENLIILNGCCHSGLINVLEYTRDLFTKPITHIIGGFHMANASRDLVDFTLNYLKKLDNQKENLYLFPIHCSGEQIIEAINRAQFEKIHAFNASVGTVFKFDSY